MDVVKYFYEEPFALEVLTDDADPDARPRASGSLEALLAVPQTARGYLAGTHLAPSGAHRVGLTALAHPAGIAQALRGCSEGAPWWRGGEALDAEAVTQCLLHPSENTVLVASAERPDAQLLTSARTSERRAGIPAIRRLLETAALVLFSEPAHDGHDWSFFASTPVRDRLTVALRRHRAPGQRLYAIPFQKARGEHTFYFERYNLERFATYEL